MISLNEIKKYFSKQEQLIPQAILKEYLQYKILEIIFSSKFGNQLAFIGGTAIRIVYGNDRFSKDIDLDSHGLEEKDFAELMIIIKRELEKEDLIVEIRNVYKGVYQCYLRFPKLLFQNKLSNLEDEKILIQIDNFPNQDKLTTKTKVINKADIFMQIRTYPPDIILSQKIFALCNRKRAKGRDIYDIIYLFSLTQPNWKFLKNKIKISNIDELKNKLQSLFTKKDLKNLAQDVEPFLINPKKILRIELFNEWIKNL